MSIAGWSIAFEPFNRIWRCRAISSSASPERPTSDFDDTMQLIRDVAMRLRSRSNTRRARERPVRLLDDHVRMQ
jgi:hypothetical protein